MSKGERIEASVHFAKQAGRNVLVRGNPSTDAYRAILKQMLFSLNHSPQMA